MKKIIPAMQGNTIEVETDDAISSITLVYALSDPAVMRLRTAHLLELARELVPAPRPLREYMAEVTEVNRLNGWFDADRPFSADVALLHSEVSEAYEGFRNGDWTNVHEELADVFIRLMDTCHRHGVDLEKEVERKLIRNRARGHKHGGKVE